MTEMTADIMPPEEWWLPGRLPGEPAAYAGADIHVSLAGADVYEEGVLVDVEARFRRRMDYDAQREIARQMGAHRSDGWKHDGPHLIYDLGHSARAGVALAERDLPDAAPWGHRSTGRLWRMCYWIPFMGRTDADLRLIFSWPAQSVRAEHTYARATVTSGLADARQLWPRE